MERCRRVSGFVFFFLALVMVCLFSGCGKKGNPFPEKSGSLVVPAKDISVEFELVSQDGQTLTVRMKNLSGKLCDYSDSYLIEYDYEGAWYKVPAQSVLGNGKTAAGEEVIRTFDTKETVGKLPSGHYRFIQPISLYVYQDNEFSDRENYKVAVEFTI